MSSAGDGEKPSPDPKPWSEHVLEQAILLQNDACAAVRAATARLAEIRATATAHSLSTLEMVKGYVAEADELAVAKLKEGVLVASANPLVSCSVAVGLGVVGLKGPRRFFFLHLRRLFVNEESLLSSAEAKAKELKDAFANLKHEGKKLEERASMAENDFLSGRTRLRHAGQQIEGVIRSTYRVEKEIRGLKDVVGGLPRKDAALFRSKISSLSSEVKREKASLGKEVSKITGYGISI